MVAERGGGSFFCKIQAGNSFSFYAKLHFARQHFQEHFFCIRRQIPYDHFTNKKRTDKKTGKLCFSVERTVQCSAVGKILC